VPVPPGASGRHAGEWLLLAAALVAFGAVLAGYLTYMVVHPPSWTLDLVDLHVYRDGGLVARHAVPPYSPHRAAPLYEWRGYGSLRLKFTYPPFAAAVFALLSYLPWAVLAGLSVAASLALLVAALWFTLGGLGYRRNRLRLAATLLIAALVFWTEPVLRTVYLGQVNLALMALIVWDLSQPDTKASRWWKGASVGIAAGIKLIPLIFIPYLLLTHRFRQAALACGAFAATVLAGYLVLPADSARWWLHGLFLQTGRTGFIGWEGNQSLPALITRLSGSIAAGKPIWLAAAAVTAIAGLACAATLDRAGHQTAGLLACALTGLLVSPISWDHHWVWIAPGVAVAAHYAADAMRGGARWKAAGFCALAAGIAVLYGAWPGSLWGEPRDLGNFSLGVIWAPPNTNPSLYYRLGDRASFPEYHWHGAQLLIGNAFVFGGLLLLAILAMLTVRARSTPAAGQAAGPQPLHAPM
jgi:alpha-1,2-mannosyltransferase